jgi:REP element-mobilizing transposase RayT
MTPLEIYLQDLREIRSTGAGVKETSYYPTLSNLLNEVGKHLKPRVRCVINLANRGAGLPDGGLFTGDQFQKASDAEPLPGQKPARGVIEVKSTKDDAWVTADGEQVSRYWGSYRQVLVTNYRDFVLVGQDAEGNPAKLQPFRLADSEKAFWAAAQHPRSFAERIGARFEEYLQRVMRHAAPLATPEDVAWFLASYARDARARIEVAEHPALATVRTALEEALGLKFEGEKGEHFFRSSLVQTLFYGVFSAWVLWSKQRNAGFQPAPGSRQDAGVTGRFNWYETARYLRVPMISKLYHLVADQSELEALKLTEVLDWAGLVLNRVDRASFFKNFQESHAVQYFYEPFLEAFDPELRKELGVWYTPPEIVKYMVERVDTVLRQELDLPLGLADKNVYVLDPCCGTGSYLVEVLDRIHRTLKERGEDALTASDLKEAAQKRVFGFEILPAPFVVSHLQLGLLLQNLGAPLSVTPASSRHGRQDGGVTHAPERVAVYLTNALTGWEPPKGPKKQLTFWELQEERDAAEHIKQNVPILVVLGNPPYNSYAGIAKMEEERDLSEAYRTTKKAPAPQGHGLNDLYVRFFRMAERRIVERTGRGVVCLISNYSWLDGLSFTGMRERYLEAFDRIWIDCLNGDKYKTGKLTPEGLPDPSVFSTESNREGIQVGTAIALLVRNAGFQPAPESRRDAGSTTQGKVEADLTIPPFRYEYVAKRGRGYLPHWEMEGATYSVTFRLGDSLPRAIRDEIDFERKDIVKTAQQLGRDLTDQEKSRLAELHRRFDEALDAGYGFCYLAQTKVAEAVYNALLHFNGERYNMVAACVMPNHAHAVFSPAQGYELENILHSWKSFTSNEANKILGRKGQFWEHEYFDRLVRDADELQRTVQYVIENPAKAGLQDWKWVWVQDAIRNAGLQQAPASRQDAGVTVGQQGAVRSIVRFRHLWGKTKRQQLLESADQNGKELYRELNPPLNLGLPLAPMQTDAGYLSWPLLPDLFPVSFPGVKTSRDDVVVDVDRQRLLDRMKQYFGPEVSHEEMRRIAPGSTTSTARFQAESVRDYLRKRGFLDKNIVRYCYRPFDVRWLYWEPETKLLDEKRSEYFPQVFTENVWIVSQQKPRRDWSKPQFIRSIGCLDLMDRCASCIPLYLKQPDDIRPLISGENRRTARPSWNGIVFNISDSIVDYLRGVDAIARAPDVFYHALAILHAPAYAAENSGGLRQDWPRIPLPDSRELLLASAELGKQIAALLDTETPFVAPASSRQPGDAADITTLQHIGVFKLQPGTVLEEEKHFVITAGWGHAGKGGVTMPGKGKLVERDYTPAEGTAGFQSAPESRQDAGATGATEAAQRDAAGTLGDRTCDVYLNDVAYWSNIPVRVWEYTIGGYQVIKKWLSYRELNLLGRPLTKEEVRYVQEMARRIASLIMLEPALDENYRSVKALCCPWPTKTKA